MKQKPRAVITHRIHQQVLDFLSPHFELAANQTEGTLPRPEIMARAAHAQAMMAFMPDSIDASFMAACPELKIVAGALKGCDNFDLKAMERSGAWFTIVPDLLTIPTAELALGLLIGLTRNILAGDRLVRSGGYRGWRPVLFGSGLTGKTLGIIGLGRVGKALVRRLAGFEMKLIYHDTAPADPAEEKSLGLAFGEMDMLLAASDYLVPLVPLTPDTRHLVGRNAMAKLKPGAFLINVCRGGVVDEEAVADALEKGRLAGYAADVFEMEDWALADRPEKVCPRFLAMAEKTLFTPHLGSAVDEVRLEIELEAARNLMDWLEGRPPRGAMNRPRGPSV